MKEDYIAKDLWEDVKGYMKRIRSDIDLYKKLKTLKFIEPSEKADKFCAFWDLRRYAEHHNCLIAIFEAVDESDEIPIENPQNVYAHFVMKIEYLYDILKENGFATE